MLGIGLICPAIAGQHASQQNINIFISNWQKNNSPVVLIKEIPLTYTTKEDTPRDIPNFTREGMIDEASRLIVGKVVLSTTDSVNLGTIVLLERQVLEQSGAGYGESPFWIVDMSKDHHRGLNCIKELDKDGLVLYVLEEFTCVWNGNELRLRPDLLHGVWKQMLNKDKNLSELNLDGFFFHFFLTISPSSKNMQHVKKRLDYKLSLCKLDKRIKGMIL